MTEKMSLQGENAVAISRKTCEKLILEPDGNAVKAKIYRSGGLVIIR